MALVADVELLQQRLDALTTLVDVTCRLAAEHDLDHILRIVTDGVCEALRCERASLFLHDEQRHELYTRIATELEIAEIRHPIQQGITGWVARHRETANIPDPRTDGRWIAKFDQQTGFSTRNILAAPVISSHDQRLLGVLELLNKIDGEFESFDEQLVQAFASHAATALERAELLEKARCAKELQLSIEMGRRIQGHFLPNRLPDVPDYEIAAWWQPAEFVSGDYYDWLWLPDGRLGLVVADVSGHGIGPSMLMASVRAMLHVLTRTTSDPAVILRLLNDTIAPDLHEGRFITLLLVALDFRRHHVTYVNAGHGPALHFRRASGEFQHLISTSLPLGFPMLDGPMHSPTLDLAPGDLLLLGTDGIVELRNEHGEMFGRERLEALVREHRTLPATRLVAILSEAITNFHPNAQPPDDSTLVIIERKYRDAVAGTRLIDSIA